MKIYDFRDPEAPQTDVWGTCKVCGEPVHGDQLYIEVYNDDLVHLGCLDGKEPDELVKILRLEVMRGGI